jgi:hypothetical protein
MFVFVFVCGACVRACGRNEHLIVLNYDFMHSVLLFVLTNCTITPSNAVPFM